MALIPRVPFTGTATVPVLNIQAQGTGAAPAGFGGSDGWDFYSDSYYWRSEFYQNKLIAGVYATSPGPFAAAFAGWTGTLNDAGYSETAQIAVTTTAVAGRHEFYEWGKAGSGQGSSFTHYWTDDDGVDRWMTWGVFFIVADTWDVYSEPLHHTAVPGTVSLAIGNSVNFYVKAGQNLTGYGSQFSFAIYDQDIASDAIPAGLSNMAVAGYAAAIGSEYYNIVTFTPRKSGAYTIYLTSGGFGGAAFNTVPIHVSVAPDTTVRPFPPIESHWEMVLIGAIGLPSGGGSPRLYLASVRRYIDQQAFGTLYKTLSATRVSVSLDFGDTFRAGVDVGAESYTGGALGDAIGFGGDKFSDTSPRLSMIVLPSGRIYVNGAAGNGIPGAWKSARISDDGQNWRNATQENVAYDERATFLSGGYLTAWISRGAYAGSKGAGGRTGGAWILMGYGPFANTSDLNSGQARVSVDGGDTWAVDTTMKGKGYRRPLRQPNHLRGISHDGLYSSLDDYRKQAQLAPPGDFLGNPDIYHANSIPLLTASTDVTYAIQATDLRTQLYISRRADFTIDTIIQMKVSPAGDGTGLIDLAITPTVVTGFAWHGRIVIVTADPLSLETYRVYISENDGKWFRQTCWTKDNMKTWVEYTP